MSNIRTKLLLAALSLPLSLTVMAQVGEPRYDFAVGVSGGVNLNRISFSPSIKQNSFIGPTLGITARYTSEKYFNTYCSVQVELNYSRLGWNENIMNPAGEELPDTYERSIDYVQLPLLTRLAWGREHRGLMFYILAGPQIGYCLGESSKQSETWTLNADGNPDRPNAVYQQYNMSVENKFDYGITGGLGIELNTKAGHFMIEGRYYYGLGDIYGNSKKDIFERSAHGTIQIKTAYLFSISGRNNRK